MKVWIVQGWDEEPRAVFGNSRSARQFAEAQRDYESRERNEDGTGSDIYPFIFEYEVQNRTKRLRFYKAHGGYHAFRIGERWLYWFEGRLRFSKYANSVGKFGK